jgi:hypothetical protein
MPSSRDNAYRHCFDVKITIGITLHLPHRLIRYAAMIVIKLHLATNAQTADPGVLSSVDVRCLRAVIDGRHGVSPL